MDISRLRGRSAVITGASRGIGAGLAEYFHAHGMNLALAARSTCPLDDCRGAAIEGGRAGAVYSARFDVRDESEMEAFADQAVERFGAIDLWVNNAGVLEPIDALRDLEWSAFREHLDINLGGVFLGTRAMVRRHRTRAAAAAEAIDATLINISSGAAWSGYAGWSAYCAGKAGVDRLTEAVQLEEADTGLRCYAVAPGIVDTAMQELIRSCPEEKFPMVGKFHQFRDEGAFNSPRFVADHLLRYAFDDAARPEAVVVRIPAEVDPTPSAS